MRKKQCTPTYTTGIPLKNLIQNYCNSLKQKKGRFAKETMLRPISVLNLLGMKPGKANSSGYLPIKCPFHKNGKEKNPSLNVHQITGNFICHACGAKGGDILAFYRRVTGTTFIDAAKSLNAWRVEW